MTSQIACAPPEPLPALDVRGASVDELAAVARMQEQRYLEGRPSSDRAATELFRRAVDDHNEDAWAAIVSVYRGVLGAHSSRIVVRGLVREDDQFCVDRAFERFWRATRATGLAQFPDLASILKYLKLCLASVLLDEARQRRRQLAVSLDSMEPEASLSEDPAAEATAHTAGSELWAAVHRELKTERERLVARLSFVKGLTPRQIYSRHSDRFGDVAEIYRIKRNIIERLRHSAAIRELRA